MFARNITKNNDFIKTFGNTLTNDHTIDPHQTDKYGTGRGGNLNSIDTEGFFNFEPCSRTDSPYQNHFTPPGALDMPWSNNEGTFRSLTPPNSTPFSPKSWPYGGHQQGNPSTIFTNINPTSTRTHYGQVTPPDDDKDNESLLDRQLAEQSEQKEVQPTRDTGKGKRKRHSTHTDSTNPPPKRTRKYTSRRANNTNEIPTKPEDAKRSKFLERNRVAASKCRQKKKEWTQNLENRARELQKDNNQLRMIMDSCRQEILFLKGEVLKHSQCDCEAIQNFIKSGTNDFTDLDNMDDLFKRESSPTESIAASRIGTIDADPDRTTDFVSPSPTIEPNHASIAGDDCALEALLTHSMSHDTSHEGLTPQIAVAAAA